MRDGAPRRFRTGALERVRPLRPIRVLLVGRDARYQRAVDFLLGANGYETARRTHAPDLLDAVEKARADVVVLDGTDLLEATARQAAALAATSERVGIVVIVDRVPPADGPRVLFVAKWAAFDTLLVAVERAWSGLRPGSNFDDSRSVSERSQD